MKIQTCISFQYHDLPQYKQMSGDKWKNPEINMFRLVQFFANNLAYIHYYEWTCIFLDLPLYQILFHNISDVRIIKRVGELRIAFIYFSSKMYEMND